MSEHDELQDNVPEVEDEIEKESGADMFRNELFDWVQNIAVILTAVIFIFVFMFRVIGVDGDSMNPTLHDKDWMVISNLFYDPEPGDIVVLTKKQFMENPIVKRVIAVEGQTVDINFDTGVVKIDGQVLDEPYIAEKTRRQFDVSFPVTVPENCVFVMGDNRMHSSDSRVSSLGMVDEKYILGRLLIRIYPFNQIGPVD